MSSGERHLDVAEFDAVSDALGADPLKLLKAAVVRRAKRRRSGAAVGPTRWRLPTAQRIDGREIGPGPQSLFPGMWEQFFPMPID